ncbi:hypothetical protein PT276_08120 [Orbaceae bacterium ESL0721]|nr:hypothetical protein [Orbaceae bacterium ESL0721]
MDKYKPIDCYDYEKVFSLPHATGVPVLQDLVNRFSHAAGAFVKDDEGGRQTAFNLGQKSVIDYIIAQLNEAKRGNK